MIIDCHGHYTTEPDGFLNFRKEQLSSVSSKENFDGAELIANISDDEMKEKLEGAQLRLQKERGTNLTIFSPRASGMGHHLGTEKTGYVWTRLCNDMVRRVCDIYPDNFVPVCQLPQHPGVNPKNCILELERCVKEMGFIGCNLSPDPSGGMWTDPPMTDEWWFPLYEKIEELDVPVMIHVSGSCNPNFHHTGAHYLCADTAVFMQLLLSDLFGRFPRLRFIIPHGGGAVPYHWGRYRGLAQDLGRPPLDELLLDNVFFDTCVYHQAGIDLMTSVIPTKNILFASEMVGAVKGIDPETGFHFDHTKRYIDNTPHLDENGRKMIFEKNIRRVFPRLEI